MLYHVWDYVRIVLVSKPRTARGASAVEYGLLVALIALAIILAVKGLGTKLGTTFGKAGSSLPS